jgi:hypothetical protein
MRKRFQELHTYKESKFSLYIECYDLLWKGSREYQETYNSETRHGIEKDINKL